jgi:hypothetical protein
MRNQAGGNLKDIGIERQVFMKANERTYDFLNSVYSSGIADRAIPEQQLCDSDKCRIYDEKYGVLYFNNAHLSIAGARLIASKMIL